MQDESPPTRKGPLGPGLPKHRSCSPSLNRRKTNSQSRQAEDERSAIRGRGRGANGFTLIELLVALAVFAIAALTLLRMEGASIQRTADLDQRLLREVVAQNLAAEWLTDPAPPALGESTGQTTNLGRSFAWTRRVDAANQAGVIRVIISVREVTRGNGSQAFTLEFMRPGGS